MEERWKRQRRDFSAAHSWYLKSLATREKLGDEFGAAVAIDGDIVVVGAPQYHVNSAATGAAFVYRRTGSVWSAGTQLSGGEGSGWGYGSAVAVDGTTIAIAVQKPSTHTRSSRLRPL